MVPKPGYSPSMPLGLWCTGSRSPRHGSNGGHTSCPCPHPVSKKEWSGSMLARSGAPALNPSPFTALSKAVAGGTYVGGAFLGRLSHGSSYLEGGTWRATCPKPGSFGTPAGPNLPVLTGENFGRSRNGSGNWRVSHSITEHRLMLLLTSPGPRRTLQGSSAASVEGANRDAGHFCYKT